MNSFARALARAFLTMTVTLAVLVSATQARAVDLETTDDHSAEMPSRENVEMNRALIESEFAEKADPALVNFATQDWVLQMNAKVDPKRVVPKDLLATTLAYLGKNKSKFKNQKVVTIVDFGSHSREARLFVVDLSGKDTLVYHTTHGVGSDPEDTGKAKVFGNVVDSGMSSIGFFRTAETYKGTYGYAIRIDGLSTTNSKVRERAVVFHGWKDAVEEDVKQKRSHGCFAFDFHVRDEIIDAIKGGSLIYANVSQSL